MVSHIQENEESMEDDSVEVDELFEDLDSVEV